MNDQSAQNFKGQKTASPTLYPASHDAGSAATVHDLLDRLVLQNRKIEALERILAGAVSGLAAVSEDVVRVAPKLKGTPDLAEAPRRSARHPAPWWPSRAAPAHALEPSPGAQCMHLKGTGAKVLAFAVFGLDGEALNAEVARVAREQLQQANFIPLFLTDARNHDVFRRHRYSFEYFPADGAATDIDSIQPRLEHLEAKWGVDLFINLGLPKGAWIRRETRPLAERYLTAKSHFAAGRYAQAKRVLTGFSEALAAEARYRVFGKAAAKPKASVIVVSHADNPGVKPGLASIARQAARRNFEVILVDNGNTALAGYGKELFSSFGLAEPGFNSGPGAARNLGAHHARAPYLIFLDDDGIAGDGCLDALIRAIEETGAVGVRGKVLPLTSPELTAPHYDLGPARLPALTTTEGIAIWDRKAYMASGGYDALLYGHEGVELCARMWRFYGPTGFIYEPSAVLYHDYAVDAAATAAKKKRYEAYGAYIDTLGTRFREINQMQNRFVGDPMLGTLVLWKPAEAKVQRHETVSVITTAKNAKHFLEEFSRSLRDQTDGDFDVVFIDDNSTDGTLEEITRLWQGDPRMRVFANDGKGRGAALNTAMRNCTADICVVADVDDISVPARIARTRSYFAAEPGMECVSFVAFNEKNPFRLGPPRSHFVNDVAVRQLFGMPVSFPTFAFRRERFPHAFNEDLPGGIDCEWLFRRIAKEQIKGQIVFFPAVYYREHDGQITASRKGTQLEIRKQVVLDAYARVLGSLSQDDRDMILLLGDTKKATAALKAKLSRWVAAFVQANVARLVFDPLLLEQAMTEALRDVAVIPG